MSNNRPPHYIKEWRKHRGLTQERLADRLDKTQSWVSQIEQFKIEYTQGMLQALGEALNCDPADLLSVNPLVAGEVVDITALLRGAPLLVQQQALAAAKAVLQTGTGGIANFFGDVDADDKASPPVGRTSEGRGAYKR